MKFLLFSPRFFYIYHSMPKFYFVVFFAFFLGFNSFAQLLQTDTASVYTFTERMPEFKGGENALFEHLSRNIRYPKAARDAGIQGVVYVTFVVERDGKISNTSVLRDVKDSTGQTFGLGEEAARVVSSMPAWNPGSQKGANVRVQCNLPIKFTLRENTEE